MLVGVVIVSVFYVAAAGAQERTMFAAPVADHHLHIRSATAAALLEEINAVLDTEDRGQSLAAIDSSQALQALDKAGIQRGLILSNAYMFGIPDVDVADEFAGVRAENDFIAQQARQSKGRLAGLCSVNPLADYALEEVQRCQFELKLAGLKLHLANSDLDLRDAEHVRSLKALFRMLNVLEFPVLAHIRTRNPDYGAEDAKIFIDEILSQAPQVSIQIAHMAGWGGFDAATEAAMAEFLAAFEEERLDVAKVQFDLAAVVIDPEHLDAIDAAEETPHQIRLSNRRLSMVIDRLQPHQVLFASDWSGWPPHVEMAEQISAYADSLPRLLSLSPERLEQLLQTQGRLLGD
jgi:predicted TIM-barrel fold metal-dependent hydrolase